MSRKDRQSQAPSCGAFRPGFIGLLTAFMLLAATSAAYGTSNFYWYGESNSTCWQTGQPGASSSACDSVGAGYLPTPGGGAGGLAHMVEGGIAPQIQLSTSGDYCGYYRLGDQLTSQDSSNEGGWTGYTTPTPYSSYQEWDGHQNVCQAYGSHWGQEVRDTAPGNGCWTTCGMNHYVSFGSQGTNDRPWSSWFGNPTLVISEEADPQVLNRTGSGTNVGAWGYVCPVLKDTTTGDVLEYCLQEWRSKYNSSEWANERIGTCAGSGNTAIDTIQSYFWPGTQFATEYSGSANTFVFEGNGLRHFEAGITKANLEDAINVDNATCKRASSTNPANYALIGVEHGLEGWRELALLGGSTANLQLRTEYTQSSPPLTVFYAGSGDTLQSSWWTGANWGYVNINVPMGPGSSPAVDLFPPPGWYDVYFRGSNGELQEDLYTGEGGWHLYGLGPAVEAGTTPSIRHPQVGGETAVYYAGASDTLEVSWWNGEKWQSANVNVPIAPGSSPAADPHPPAGWDDVYFRGSNGELQEDLYTGEGGWHLYGLGPAVEAGTTPSIRHPQVGGETAVYYAGASDTLEVSWWNGEKWQSANVNVPIAPGSSPAADPHPPAGWDDVYFRGSNGELQEDLYTGEGGWHLYGLGHAMAAGTTPTIVHPQVGGETYVYYVGSNGILQESWWNGSTWQWGSLGVSVETGTNPAGL